MQSLCENIFERRFYSIVDPVTNGTSTPANIEAFSTVKLETSQVFPSNPSGGGFTAVAYPDAFESPVFLVDANSNIIIKVAGLYSIQVTTVIKSDLSDVGTRTSWVTANGNQTNKYGLTASIVNTQTDPNCCTLHSTFNLSLEIGDELTHWFKHNAPADIFLQGDDISLDFFTNMKVILTSPRPI